MRQSEKEARFLEVVNGNRQLLCKVCYMYAADRDHFQDLYQEVLANIWVGLDTFRPFPPGFTAPRSIPASPFSGVITPTHLR